MTPERKKAVLDAIAKGLNGISPTSDVAHNLGYRPARKGVLATTQSLRSLERAGIVGRIGPRDQWDSAHWFIIK